MGIFSNGIFGGKGQEMLGDIFGTGQSSAREQAEKDREFNSQQAQLDRDFQKEMSNTAVQRRMEDLKASGINPLLAGMDSGSAASQPSGSNASSSGKGASNSGVITLLSKALDKIPSIPKSGRQVIKQTKFKWEK